MPSEDGSHTPSDESQDSSVRAAEALVPVWIELERLLPNFASRYVRRFCRSLVQEAVENVPLVAGEDERVEGPICIRRKLDEHQQSPVPTNTGELCRLGKCFCDLLKPSKTPEFMSILMVDVSDFSSKMSSLKECLGPTGLEQFSKGIKRYFDGIIQKVLAYGGDIVKFAGDSVVMCWRIERDHLAAGEASAKEEAVFRSYQCACSLIQRYGEYLLEGHDSIGSETLKIHVCLGAGDAYDVNVGVTHGRWEHFLAGKIVNEMGRALDLTKGGELSITKEVHSILREVVKFNVNSLAQTDDVFIIKKDYNVERIRPALPLSINSVMRTWENIDERGSYELYKRFISDSAVYKLETDVLQSKLFFDSPTLSDLLGFYELREAATMFVRLPSLSDWSEESALLRAQKVMEVASNAVELYGGVIRQFNYDDKGSSILSFFGIPPSSGSKCAYRAATAAIEMRNMLINASIPFSIGLAYGTVFISGVGNSVRTEYCALGDSINLGARLMCQKMACGTILCDEQTAVVSGWNFRVRRVQNIKSIKGFSKPMKVFEILGISPPTYSDPGPVPVCEVGSHKSVIGLSSQRKAIKETLSGTSTPSCTAITGEYDQGLTTLYEYSVSNATSLKISSINIICKDKERFNQLGTIKRIVRRLVAIIDKMDIQPSDEARDYIKPRRRQPPVALGTAPKSLRNLLTFRNNMLPLRTDEPNNDTKSSAKVSTSPTIESPITELLNHSDLLSQKSDNALFKDFTDRDAALCKEDESEHHNWRKLVQSDTIIGDSISTKIYSDSLFIFEAAERCNIAIIVHELQFMDIESWVLLWYIIQTFPKLRVLLFTRANSDADTQWLNVTHCQDSPALYVRRLSIEKLTRDEISMLVAHFWPFHDEIKGITEESLQFLSAASSGSPNCVASIVSWIKSSKRWSLLPGSIIEFNFGVLGGTSDDYNAIVVSQFDGLGPRFRLVLKVTSVASPDVSFDDIYRVLTRVRWIRIFGLKFNRPQRNKRILEELDVFNFLDLEFYDGELYIRFTSAKIQKIIYNLNVISQRAPLHRLIGDQCSERFMAERDISLLCPAIHHYKRSGPSRIELLIKYTEVLARHRSGVGTIKGKIVLYERLLSIAGCKPDVGIPLFSSAWRWRVIQSHWCNKLAKLHALCGNYEEFEKFISHSLCLLGCTSTRNRDGICTYCRLQVGQMAVESFAPLTNFASQIHQKLKHRRSVPYNFVNYYTTQDVYTWALPLPQYHNGSNSKLDPQYTHVGQSVQTKYENVDMENMGKKILEYITEAVKIHSTLAQDKTEKLTKVPLDDLKYVETVMERVRKEDGFMVDALITSGISKHCTVNSIIVNKETLMNFLPYLFDSFNNSSSCSRKRAKCYAVAALTLSTCSKNLGLIANFVGEAIKCDDMKTPSTTAYIIINLTHVLFYTSLWAHCDAATSIYFLDRRIKPGIRHTEQTVFYGILMFIRIFLTGPVTNLHLAISHLFTLSIKISSGFVGLYVNAMLDLCSLVVAEKQNILPLPSRSPIEKKEILFQTALSLYKDMRYEECFDLSDSANVAIEAIKKKRVPLSPVTVFSVTLMMVCYVAFLLRNPGYRKQKESKSVFKLAKLILRLYHDKNLPGNLHIINKPLYALCSAVICIFRKGPMGSVGPLRSVLDDRNTIEENVYIRAVFSSFLLELDQESSDSDDPRKLFSYLKMTYHMNNGVFGLGVRGDKITHSAEVSPGK